MWIAICIFLVLLLVVFVVNTNRKITKLAEPELGIHNLLGANVQDLVEKDREALRPFFYGATESIATPPKCDVLFVYAQISADGALQGTNSTLRGIIAESGAKIVVIATENPAEHYTAALQKPGDGRANIVLTLERRGFIFRTFFSRLFEIMATGISMPVAWVRLAPQRPGSDHPDCPSTLFLCEIGQITFKRA